MSVKNKILVIVIVSLAIVTLVLGFLNKQSMDVSGDEGTIRFALGENLIELSFEEITSLDYEEFSAVEDTSSSGPAARKYKGVLLKEVLNKASISDEDISNSSKVIVKGLDGYVVALPSDEIMGNTAYLVFEKDGKELGTMKRGGSGPIQLVVRSDSFSQRWCKYVSEVIVE